MPDPETTGEKREVGFRRPPVEHQFKPGNPGRPKGSRNKLSEDFFKALMEDFETHGTAAIVAMRQEKPNEYAKMVAGLMTKEVEHSGDIGLSGALDALPDA